MIRKERTRPFFFSDSTLDEVRLVGVFGSISSTVSVKRVHGVVIDVAFFGLGRLCQVVTVLFSSSTW